MINDFFILNPYRGIGVAKASVSEIFSQNKGSYYISQLVQNKPAVRFWNKIYQQHGIGFEEHKELQKGASRIRTKPASFPPAIMKYGVTPSFSQISENESNS
ncbi:hypothetical protein J7I80_22000 [Bacillus sp. ISL-41]|uniref:hypothetical protein n=1 Tax=Bacillus sp. ISL-41 TaxID=2819127 RepID=UPI001BE8311E|nr:hypothetical protein [Bacillus sp. ISL-41]MBT2644896.1 hypothetical protein [Bacillus sp. ISL-41]